VILLDDNVDTLAHFVQNGMKISRDVSFAHVDSRHN
jgi:hypothetical protein